MNGTSTDESMAPDTIGALPPIRMQAPRSRPGRRALGITLMQCMHRTHALLSMSRDVPSHAMHFDRVPPGPDDAEVGARDGGHAVVRASGRLDLELVRERRAMNLVLVVLREVVGQRQGVEAGPLAACRADAATGRAHHGPRPAQVEAVLGQLGKHRLERFGLHAEQDDVAGGAVQVGQAGAVLLPDVAHLAERVGLVEPPRRVVDPHRVELRHLRKLLGHVRVTSDDARAIPADADHATVLPVADAVAVGELENTKQLVSHGAAFGGTLYLAHEAWPRTLFEVVQLWSRSSFVGHKTAYRISM